MDIYAILKNMINNEYVKNNMTNILILKSTLDIVPIGYLANDEITKEQKQDLVDLIDKYCTKLIEKKSNGEDVK